MLQPKRMDKTIRKYASIAGLDEVEADEYRYWQRRPMHERMEAVSKLSSAKYGIKGTEVRMLDKTLVRIERPPR